MRDRQSKSKYNKMQISLKQNGKENSSTKTFYADLHFVNFFIV